MLLTWLAPCPGRSDVSLTLSTMWYEERGSSVVLLARTSEESREEQLDFTDSCRISEFMHARTRTHTHMRSKNTHVV
jgi:hypothetical protein